MNISVVIDVVAYHAPKHKRGIFTGTADDVTKYINGYKKFCEDIITAYEDIRDEYKRVYGITDLKIAEPLHRLIISAYSIINPKNNKIDYCFRKDKLDIMRVEITVKYTVKPGCGAKISDIAGLQI